MNEGLSAVVNAFPCVTCKAAIGVPCTNVEGKVMQCVHVGRKLCPICKQRYSERSGRRFAHFGDQQPPACTLPKSSIEQKAKEDK